MVERHAVDAGRTILRANLDADVLADARARPNAVRRIAQILADDDFVLEEPSYMGVGHTFVKGSVEIDLLAPEHLGRRRTERGRRSRRAYGGGPWRPSSARPDGAIALSVTGREGRLPHPDLLEAILLEARAVDVDDVPEGQRSDLALLLSLVADSDALARQLRGEERQWLARRREMDDRSSGVAWLGRRRGSAWRCRASAARELEVSALHRPTEMG